MQITPTMVVVGENLLEGSNYFSSFQFTLEQDGIPLSLDRFMQMQNRTCHCSLKTSSRDLLTKCIRGDHTLWFPVGDGQGVKLILDADDTTVDNLLYINDCRSTVFPRIDTIARATISDASGRRQSVIVGMEDACYSGKGERVASSEIQRLRSFVSRGLRKGAFSVGHRSQRIDLFRYWMRTYDSCTQEFKRWKLLPEDEWHKPTNLINGKIVDCHAFEFFPQRYAFPIGELDLISLQSLYRSGPVQTRAKTLYQGFKFSNGYAFPGYSSDGREFDTYRKLPFLPMRKVKKGIVLDLGSAQGFFSFQAATHGAEEVVGIDRIPENVTFAKKLNRTCFKSDRITFLEGDIVRYVMDRRRSEADVALLLSVLHQVYPHMDGAEPFLERLASIAKFVAFETPFAHPQMLLSVNDIYNKLRGIFRIVRLLYVYNAYSSGYRAIFVCYSN